MNIKIYISYDLNNNNIQITKNNSTPVKNDLTLKIEIL